MLYGLIKTILRTATRVFFRQVQVVGLEHIAPEGDRAVLIAGNHPNSLLDPVMLLTTTDRVVHFAAKDVLFQSALLRPLLLALGAVPVARQMDHGAGSADNTKAFGAMAQVLAAGGAMGIFPEGISHDEAQLQRLKTGAARIALDVAHRLDQPVDIVPCGLTYLNPKRFRSRVLVQYGDPIEVGEDLQQAFLRDERQAVRDLTARVEAGLRALTINAGDWATLRRLDAVRRLYQPGGVTLWERVELSRRFNDVYATVADRPEVMALAARIDAYQERLDDLGLHDRDLQRPLRWTDTAVRLWVHGTDALFWMPLAVPGLILQAPIAAGIRWLHAKVSPRKDVIATTKLVMGLLAVPLLWATVVATAWWLGGPRMAILALVLLPLTGYAALRTMERGFAVTRALTSFWRMFFLAREVAVLRTERDQLQDAVVTLVDALRPATMEPLFPRPLPRMAEAAEPLVV
jgi:glycerol-3-phosphate O-acyltransferase/dihydroxyacetone phosphate acyltransferase